MARGKAVAVKEEAGSMAVTDRPDYLNDTARGSENVTTQDMTVPRLDVLQALSPQVDETEDSFIDGSKPGLFWNTATSELYGDRVMFVPVYFRMEYIVWRDIDKGGGFRGAFGTEAAAKRAMADMDDAADCQVVDTAQQFGIVVDEDGKGQPLVLSCAKTKHKPSRKLNTLVQMEGVDRFALLFELTTTTAENSSGQKYWNFNVKKLGYAPEDLYRQGEKFYEAVKSGARDVDRSQEGVGVGDEAVSPEDLDS